MIASGRKWYISILAASSMGLFLAGGASFGQDLIVINGRDSVNCKIRASDAKGIYYDYLHKGEMQKAYILKKDVIDSRKNYYNERFNGDRPLRELRPQLLRLSWQGGMGWFPVHIDRNDPTWYQDHIRALRTGAYQRVEMHFMIMENWGLGATLGSLRTTHTTDAGELHFPGVGRLTGIMQDDIHLFSYGLSGSYQHEAFHPNVYVLAIASFEQIKYRNNAIFLEPFELNGRTYSGRLGMALEYRFRNRFGLGLSAHRVIARFETLTASNDPLGRNLIMNDSEMGDMRRWDLGLGISLSY